MVSSKSGIDDDDRRANQVATSRAQADKKALTNI